MVLKLLSDAFYWTGLEFSPKRVEVSKSLQANTVKPMLRLQREQMVKEREKGSDEQADIFFKITTRASVL